jgi:subtilisin family serine protease
MVFGGVYAADFIPGQVIILSNKPLSTLSNVSTLSGAYTHLSLAGTGIESIKSLLVNVPTPKSSISAQSTSGSGSVPQMPPMYIAKLDKTAVMTDVIKSVSQLPGIRHVQPNYVYTTKLAPNDDFYDGTCVANHSLQTCTPSSGNCAYSSSLGKCVVQSDYLETIKLPEGWDTTTGSTSVIIAIIDTGVDWDHVDLTDNIAINANENTGTSSVDDDPDGGNGFIDDIRGWDFVNTTLPTGFSADGSEDYLLADNDPSDVNGHGTHVAGIASASTNNNLGVSGVGFNTKILPLRAGYSVIKDSDGETYGLFNTDSIVSALAYAADNGAQVANMSFGAIIGTDDESEVTDQALQDAVDYALDKDVLLVAAAGNSSVDVDTSGAKVVPASYSGVLTVSATTHDGTFDSRYSNFGDSVDIAAPGSTILSTAIDDNLQFLTGTSMAAPVVAGAAGLLLSIDNSLTRQEVFELLTRSATIVEGKSESTNYGKGLLNVQQAIGFLSPSTLEGVTPTVFGPEGIIKDPLNSPNPFNPSIETTDVTFFLTQSADITVYIYSMRLQRVKTLTNAAAPGLIRLPWDGLDESGSIVPNGVYPALIKVVTSSGETIQKRIKIAVLR